MSQFDIYIEKINEVIYNTHRECERQSDELLTEREEVVVSCVRPGGFHCVFDGKQTSCCHSNRWLTNSWCDKIERNRVFNKTQRITVFSKNRELQYLTKNRELKYLTKHTGLDICVVVWEKRQKDAKHVIEKIDQQIIKGS